MSRRIFKTGLIAAGALALAVTGCSDQKGGPLTPKVVIVKDGDYRTDSLDASVIKADAPGKSCEWWLFYDIPNQPNKVLVLVNSTTKMTANLKSKYTVVNRKTHKVSKYKPTSFRTDGCGRWIKVK